MGRTRSKNRNWHEALETSAMLVSVLFLVHLLGSFWPSMPPHLGIVPRSIPGLIGIVFSPFIHINSAHLLANAAPLFVLLILLFADARYRPEQTLTALWLGSGFGTWLIGRGQYRHIGASSVIFGLVVYLIVSAWWMKSWRSAAVAAVVLVCYGGIFYGILPQRGGISWEGHLAGAITGFIVARQSHT